MKVRTELPFLESLLLFNQYKVCVEVGVAKGQAAVYLCRALKELGGKYYGFDAWKRYGLSQEFKVLGSLEGVSGKLKAIPFSDYNLFQVDTMKEKEKFNQLCPDGIDFAFIDGDHSYIGIKNDFSVVYPKLADRGCIVFHDTCTIDGCREFVFDLRTKFYDGTFDIIDIPLGNGITRNPGVSILMKRYYAIESYRIDEVNGSIHTPPEIERREMVWLDNEVTKNSEAMSLLKEKIIIKDLSKLGRYLSRKKFEGI